MKKSPVAWSLVLSSLSACTSASPDGVSGTGGQLTAVGGSQASASGGSSTSSGGATASTGGRAGGGGAVATGGSAAGGSASGGQSAGGTETGSGAATSGGASGGSGAGGTGGDSAPKPSAGCSKGSAQVTIPNSLVGLPIGYTGSEPVKAVFAFHAANNPNTQLRDLYGNKDLGKNYLMVYPAAQNQGGWDIKNDEARFKAAYDALLANACVDENSIYATGHSSGSQFLVQLLCKGSGPFDGVAPVASSLYCDKWTNGAVPALVIHGIEDQERIKYNLNDGNGKKDLQPYLASNMCTMDSSPSDIDTAGCTGVKGLHGQTFAAGCVNFQGCSASTTFCNHNDPQYSDTNHGVPCFAPAAIFDFFESL